MRWSSNYVKFELLISQSSIAILKWDLALETTTRVTTRDNTSKSSAAKIALSTLLVNYIYIYILFQK